ncbi:hypothetical protein FUA23_21810 [Neolewinella aurantiaca]|uniref:Uncharacterized protein n=1 Tax=Neolewinella aurantiaca TaxID=2602767 RepID=A0A5C7F1W0_9BACT|nr:hypothetical protein [Neolewinella aurantiaca]TXF82498.1 hypothetical protein FUA23_21810 [Neolewinella aurantiaca]
MSGGGGGSIPTINRPGGGGAEDCGSLRIITSVASPDSDVLVDVSEGDILNVRTLSNEGPVIIETPDGRVVGSVLSREMIRLISCINNGIEFNAVVNSISDGRCVIEISSE